MDIYLDCNATTPMEPEVGVILRKFMEVEFGNSGSRTHSYGQRAKRAVEEARQQVATLVGAGRDEVLFTGGATESNNLAILGLAEHGRKIGKRHIVSAATEHKAVLAPLDLLAKNGFEITLVETLRGGQVRADDVAAALRDDTLLVTIMAVNNETGVIQPTAEIAEVLSGHHAFFHVDGAQGVGKLLEPYRHPRIDLLSLSGHKLYGPKGIGALVARRRGFNRVPLTPLMYGGAQERGLRPGTLPVALIAGLGLAAELALTEHSTRAATCLAFRERLIKELGPLRPIYNGDQQHTLFNTASLRFPGLDSEAVILALKGLVAISNGSACTSASYDPSHVLLAMGLSEVEAEETIRLSWCHMTPEPNWPEIRTRLERLC